MKTHKLVILAVLVLLAWFTIGPNLSWGEVILPEPGGNNSVTISIIDIVEGNDVTGTWLPKPDEFVQIVVNNVSSYSITLDQTQTSAYPGQCTNFDNPSGNPNELDFKFDSANNILTPTDCGGMAVVHVTGIDDSGASFYNLYVIPADTDMDGIADNYEKQFCTQFPEDERLTCLNPEDDNDTSPEGDLSPMGDGISVIDEARGFRVSGEYIRTDPRVKDFFIHLVDEPQCQETAGLTEDDGITPINLKTFFGEDLNPIFANMANFYTGVQVHLINSDEWIDKFVSYNRLSGVEYFSDSDPEQDRRITPNALVPPPENSNPPKGVRLIECLDLYEYSPLGLALKKAPPDGLEKNDGNAVIYTQRIWRYYKNSFDAGGSRRLQYYTFENGDWTLKETFGSPPVSEDLNLYLEDLGVNRIIKELFAFYTAHEGLGHPLDLTPTVESTKKESYGYHHADGTGTIMDVKIVQVIDRKDTEFNKFYIPVSFGISDKREMRFLSSQELIPF